MDSHEFVQHSRLHDGVTGVLLTLILAVWSCLWGAIWLLSGLYVALHFREEQHRGPAARRHEDVV
jgi:hypothetical protein